jgi:hypothetical protein
MASRCSAVRLLWRVVTRVSDCGPFNTSVFAKAVLESSRREPVEARAAVPTNLRREREEVFWSIMMVADLAFRF